MHEDLFDRLTGLCCLAEWLPWVLELDAQSFYLPARYLPATAQDWEPSWALELLQPQGGLQRALGQPVRAEKAPGRNQRCPCGSGRKYKHCCVRRQG